MIQVSSTAIVLSVALSVSVAAGGLVAYDRYVAPRPVAVVNVTGLWQKYMSSEAQMMMRADVTDAQRKQALEHAKGYGDRLLSAIQAVSVDCRCVLVTSSAVLAGSVSDYTADVESRLDGGGRK
jgi:hypothetical protein